MNKRANATTLKGNGLTLVGPALKAGDTAPDFTCATGMMDTLGLSGTPAKARLSVTSGDELTTASMQVNDGF